MHFTVAWLSLMAGGTAFFDAAGLNRTAKQQQQPIPEFSIDEVSTLNRQFVDFLVAYDGSSVESGEDQRCTKSLQQLSAAYVNRERHGLEWFDSWGKVPSGLYHGNVYALGNFEQCRRFRWEDVQGGQHCAFWASLPSSDLPLLQSGLCFPQFCNPEFVLQLYAQYLQPKGVFVLPVACNADRPIVFDGPVVTAIVIFSIVAGLVLCSTTYEIFQLYRQRPASKMYASFSLYGNIRSILHITHRSQDPQKKMETIDCANGIRALSMLWIIVLHVHETLPSIPVNNPRAMLDYIFTFPSVLMFLTGGFAVDTFLVLGGMLVSWNLLKELDKNGKINPLMLYLRRYIRITVPLAALVLFTVSFWKYMGEGILWGVVNSAMADSCTQYWWSTLLHIQNYVNPESMCLVWTWYLSVDMQLFIIGPLLIYPLWRWGKRVLLGIGTLAVLSIACVFTAFLVNDFRINGPEESIRRRYVLTYYATHARMAPWLLGTIFGYILYKTKKTGVTLSKRYYVIGWTTCFAMLALIIFATHKIYPADYQQFSGVADAFYESLSRSTFAICVMWIIFACVNGYGGIVDRILSTELWQPLAKLSFTMYLMHSILLMTASVINVKTDLHFSVTDLFYRIWGAIGLTTSGALLWSAVFEVPFVTLEKLLLRS